MLGQRARRESQRVPVSVIVRCQRADRTKVGGKAYNLSTGGVAIKTNYPIRINDRFTVEFSVPTRESSITAEGEIVWRRFHGDSPGRNETLYTAGIKFLKLDEASRNLVREYSRSSETRLFMKKQ